MNKIVTQKNFRLHNQLLMMRGQVGSSQRTEGVDYAVESIHNIKEALAELWEDSEGVKCSGKAGIET